MENITAKVKSVELVNKDVYQIALQADDLTFHAGQYLMIVLPTGEQVPYSIGSAPHELPSLTLYILVSDAESLAHKVVEHIKSNSQISIKAAGGDCHLANGVLSTTPDHILLIAGGTGFAQIKSLYSSLIEQDYQGKVSFYWGVRSYEDIFAEGWLEEAKEHAAFSINIVVNEKSEEWQGRTGWLYDAVIQDVEDLSHCTAFICGSVNMVYGTLDQLEQQGLQESNCFSDVFAYAPRPKK
ncbi:NAD(P)H-flavin reductase [Marinomonas sp. C2222]|uniref:NAD(P)H-flavin reductase n=1 Tax=Marinomonas sargassi TaxID=2984494 RepID=A0ABT2YUX3_9GAMM|nr:NAD(P)H-flavin reductase [Marinomonas sargassi]MCV2403691.1 NAD(P)H-flavin reductase [Marinomonas sargassi]